MAVSPPREQGRARAGEGVEVTGVQVRLSIQARRSGTGTAGCCGVMGLVVPKGDHGVEPVLQFGLVGNTSGAGVHPSRDGKHDAAVAYGSGQCAAVADQGRHAGDHGFGSDAAERFFEQGRDEEDTGQGEDVAGLGQAWADEDLRVSGKVKAGDGGQRGGILAGLHDQHGDVRAAAAQHVGEPGEQGRPLVKGRVDEGDEAACLGGRLGYGPVEQRRDAIGLQANAGTVGAGQEGAGGEHAVRMVNQRRSS